MIAIVDDGGNPMYLEKMDERQIGSIEVAQAKARTAIRYKRPTKALEDAVAGGRNVVMTLPGATPVEGGMPITVDGKIIARSGSAGWRPTRTASAPRPRSTPCRRSWGGRREDPT